MTTPPPVTPAQAGDDIAAILAESAARLFAEACPPAVLRRAETDAGVAESLWSSLDALGLPQACAPEDAGGSGLGWSAVCGLIESCGEHGVPVALPEMLAAQLVARRIGLELPPQARLSLAVGRREGNAILADAAGGAAAGVVVLVEVDGRVLALDVDAARMNAWRNAAGEARADLVWDGAAAALERAPSGDEAVLLAGAAIRVAQIAGATRRALALSVGYANDRVQFGKPIGKFQALQQNLAVAAEWSAMATMAARLVLADAGTRLDADRVAACREVACTAALQVAEVAHAVHGAIGVTAEYDLQLFTRRLKQWAAEFGSARYWAGRLGAGLVAAGTTTAWDRVVALTSAPALSAA
jgi:acyl-CoA dehydrogenase